MKKYEGSQMDLIAALMDNAQGKRPVVFKEIGRNSLPTIGSKKFTTQ